MEENVQSTPEIRFRFDERKTTEAAVALLLMEHSRRMDRVRLMKLLYLADRLSLERHDVPVCGDAYYSLPHGPVLTTALNLAKEEPFTQSNSTIIEGGR